MPYGADNLGKRARTVNPKSGVEQPAFWSPSPQDLYPAAHMTRSSHVEVYVFRRRGRSVEFLALRRAKGRSLAGVWQPVTGKRERRESGIACARREVLEETGLAPRRWWALENPTVYYDADRDVVEVLPLFAAEIGPRDTVRISDEHDSHRFVSISEAGRRFLWEAQRTGLAAVRTQVLAGGALSDQLEIKNSGTRRRVAG